MRFASVLGAISVGLIIGSAGVIAPLILRTANGVSPPSVSANRDVSSSVWNWATPQATPEVRSGVARSPESKALTSPVFPSDPPAVASAGGGQRDDRSAVGSLTKPPVPKLAPRADAKTAQAPWATQVTVEPDTGTPRKLTSSKPANDEQRHRLVRDLQAELKRVGCYAGEVDGQWGPSTRRSLASFTERVNASLPFDEPDLILLTLVQGHQGRACGLECPAGQAPADTGRCVPNSVLAQADRVKRLDSATTERAAPADHSAVALPWRTTALPVAPSTAATDAKPVEAGSIANLSQAPVRAIRPNRIAQATVPPGPASVAIAPKQAIAALASPDLAPAPATANRDRILPGRMTMGGALPPADNSQPTTLPATVLPPPLPHNSARLAAVDTLAQPMPSAAPVTAATAEDDAVPKAVRRPSRPRVSRPDPVYAAPKPRRAPEAVVVQRPSTRVYAPQQQANAGPGTGSKSRRMIYEMFQRPDRN